MYYVKAPAKINLTLDVLHKRPDGYHEVEMIMTTVDLADRIGLEIREDGKIQIISVDRFVPNDHRNLAYQAAKLLKDTYHVKLGVSITIEKNIPVAAGLAGGSSDAAATLRGLNTLWDLGLVVGRACRTWSEDWFRCLILCIRRNCTRNWQRRTNSRTYQPLQIVG